MFLVLGSRDIRLLIRVCITVIIIIIIIIISLK